MSYGLDIRKDAELDFLSLGALVHRLDPEIIPFRKATECGIHVSGGEYNVAATTLREVHSTNRHSWSAVAWIDGKTYTAPTAELDVYDRVGGGDGFASGFFYGLLSGGTPEEAVKLGWAHGALLTTFPGDTTMATAEQVRAFAKGGSARIQR
ncbi:MAG: PfkB family carbohydrate kinase [Terracidiphilus sp.]|jgi:2-dehydro-3-deoxygluconokinase